MRVALHAVSVTPGRGRRLGTAERIRIAAEIVASYCAARWWMVRLSFPESVSAARNVRPSSRASLDEGELDAAGIRLGNAVQRTLRALPVDSRCLVTALVLTRMLARRGIESTFVVGVRAQPRFAAHAWVERGPTALLPTWPEFQRLVEL
jgi:hypothetical protein